ELDVRGACEGLGDKFPHEQTHGPSGERGEVGGALLPSEIRIGVAVEQDFLVRDQGEGRAVRILEARLVNARLTAVDPQAVELYPIVERQRRPKGAGRDRDVLVEP